MTHFGMPLESVNMLFRVCYGFIVTNRGPGKPDEAVRDDFNLVGMRCPDMERFRIPREDPVVLGNLHVDRPVPSGTAGPDGPTERCCNDVEAETDT